jgi:hypothetical protein
MRDIVEVFAVSTGSTGVWVDGTMGAVAGKKLDNDLR